MWAKAHAGGAGGTRRSSHCVCSAAWSSGMHTTIRVADSLCVTISGCVTLSATSDTSTNASASAGSSASASTDVIVLMVAS